MPTFGVVPHPFPEVSTPWAPRFTTWKFNKYRPKVMGFGIFFCSKHRLFCLPFAKLQDCFSDWNLWMLDHRNLCWCPFSVVGVLKNYKFISFHVPLKLAGCSTKTWHKIEVLPSTSLRLFRCQEKMMKIQPGPKLTDFLCRICWYPVVKRTGWSMMKMSSLASWAPPSR